MFEDGYVVERIAANGNSVGQQFLSSAHLVRLAEGVGSVYRHGQNGTDGLHGPLDHPGKLFCVPAVRVDAGVDAEDRLSSAWNALRKFSRCRRAIRRSLSRDRGGAPFFSPLARM